MDPFSALLSGHPTSPNPLGRRGSREGTGRDMENAIENGFNPEENHIGAIAYDKQGNDSEMYLGVWQAVDGEEFVLGDNVRTLGRPCQQ